MLINAKWRSTTLCLMALAAVIHLRASEIPDVWLSYSLARSDVSVAEPIFVNAVATNGADETILIDLGLDFHGNFRATLNRPDGRIDKVSGREYIHQAGYPGEISLVGHSSVQKVLLLNRWFSFDVPGRYFVALELAANALDPGAKVALISRGGLVIDVGPRDPHRLADRCAELYERVMEAPKVAAGASHAEALGYTRDAVAVPYLARLAEAKPLLDSTVVDGLRRIGDSSAVEVLISRLDQPSKDSRDLARYALSELERGTKDPLIRERVRAVVR